MELINTQRNEFEHKRLHIISLTHLYEIFRTGKPTETERSVFAGTVWVREENMG
jgi:hypothetical protein